MTSLQSQSHSLLLAQIKNFLSKPFPQEESLRQTLWIISGISLFIFLFLLIFQPSGIHQLESKLLPICFGFGVVAFVTMLLYELLVVFVLQIKGVGVEVASFTFGRWFFYMVGLMFCISLSNFVYIRFIFFDGIDWSLFPAMIRGTFLVGLLPTVLLGAIALVRQEHKYQSVAAEVNQRWQAGDQNSSLESSHNAVDRPSTVLAQETRLLGVAVDQIRFIEAMQNYVTIVYLDEELQLQEKVERSTMKRLLTDYEDTPLVQCHRSFLVNGSHIVTASGNSQGLLLKLSDVEKEIPVSRSFVSQFRN